MANAAQASTATCASSMPPASSCSISPSYFGPGAANAATAAGVAPASRQLLRRRECVPATPATTRRSAGSGSNAAATVGSYSALARAPEPRATPGSAGISASRRQRHAERRGGIASANTGQTITLTGSGLLSGEPLVFSAIDASGRLYEQTVNAASVAADGTQPDGGRARPAATTGHVRLLRGRLPACCCRSCPR